MAEQMTLERVRDIMSDYIYPSTDYVNGLSPKMLQQWIDAIDAHLNAAKGEAVEVSPEFTVSARAAIAWVLWHHQGSSSPIGQPLRFALGMGDHEQLQDWRIREAKHWAAMTKATTAAFHTASPDVVRDAERYRWLRDKSVHFELPDRGTPYCVYGLGMGDSEPTWGTELDSMVDYCMNQDAAMAAREGGE